MEYLFVGGVLDGKRFEVGEVKELKVPVKDGQWFFPPDQVVQEYQVYVPNPEGLVFELRSTDDGRAGNGADGVETLGS